MNFKLMFLKLLFGSVTDLLDLLKHVQSALVAESLRLHEEADALQQKVNLARASADAASNVARKLS